MNEEKYEKLITELIERKFGIFNQFLDENLLNGLRANLIDYKQKGLMHPAGIGKNFDYKENLEVRGDVIKWIDENSSNPYEKEFMELIESFIQYLNRTCYTKINGYEFHYAYYEAGSFYKRHLDQFKSDKARQFSLVTYLNEDWKTKDKGNLRLFLDDKVADIYPKGGRCVFFKSDEVEHEVIASPERPRMSIAGWLKSV